MRLDSHWNSPSATSANIAARTAPPGIARARVTSVRLVSKIITSASSDAAMTMMVMNLVSERRDSTAERSSLRGGSPPRR